MNRTCRNRGSILVLTLWVIALLAVMAMGMTKRTRLDVRVAAWSGAEMEARELLASLAKHCVSRITADTDADVDSPKEEWGFPLYLDGAEVLLDFGSVSGAEADFQMKAITQDECGKVNVNFCPEELLVELLQEAGAGAAAQEIAAAIVDWRDTDSEGLAEIGTYEDVDTSYEPSNTDLKNIEELLFVKGVNPLLFFGEDANHNSQLDREEDDGDSFWPPDNSDGVLQPGLLDLLTVYGSEDGVIGVNINTAPESVLRAVLRFVLDDDGEAETLAEEIVKKRCGREGVEWGESFVPFTSDEEISEVVNAEIIGLAAAREVEFVVQSEAFRFYLSIALPDNHVFADADLVVSCRDDEIRVAEWHE